MKKIICIALVVVVLGAAAYFILFRPSSVTSGGVKKDFEGSKSSFVTVAEYLTKNSIKAEIKGLITLADQYGVPKVNEDDYKAFNAAVEVLMGKFSMTSIISDGSSVEFVLESSGGVLTKRGASIIYNGKPSVDGRETEPLDISGWHLIVE